MSLSLNIVLWSHSYVSSLVFKEKGRKAVQGKHWAHVKQIQRILEKRVSSTCLNGKLSFLRRCRPSVAETFAGREVGWAIPAATWKCHLQKSLHKLSHLPSQLISRPHGQSYTNIIFPHAILYYSLLCWCLEIFLGYWKHLLYLRNRRWDLIKLRKR